MKTEKMNTEEKLKYNPDVTKQDKDVLNQAHIRGDGGNDQQLKDRNKDVNFSNSQLDIPKPTQDAGNNKPLNDKENGLYDGTTKS